MPTRIQCSRRDLNPHGLPRRNLNPVGMYRDAARCSETRISPGCSLHLAAFRYTTWTIQGRFRGRSRHSGRGRAFRNEGAAGSDSVKARRVDGQVAGVRVASFETDCGRSARSPNRIEFVLSAISGFGLAGAARTARRVAQWATRPVRVARDFWVRSGVRNALHW